MKTDKEFSFHSYETAYLLIEQLAIKNMNYEKSIKEIFEIMGNKLNLDILELNLFNNHLFGFLNKHIWKKRDIEKKDFMNLTSIVMKESLFDIYPNAKYIKIDDTSKLNHEIRHFRTIYTLLHIKSICAFPLRINEEIVGEVILKHLLQKRKFTDDQIKFLVKCHEIINVLFIKEYNTIILDMNKNNYVKMLENLIYPVALVDKNYHLISVNYEFESLFLTSFKKLENIDFLEYISEYNSKPIIDILDKATNQIRAEFEIFKIINNEKKIIRIVPFPLVSKDITLIAIVFKDVTSFKLEEKHIIKMAYFDLATNLHNRNYYLQICQTLEKMNYQSLGVIVLGIDNLIQINEQYGHEKGNEVIIQVSNSLKQVFLDAFLISRIGGNEFTIFILNQHEDIILQQINQLKMNVKNKLNENYISIGYCYTENHAANIYKIINKADTNMYIEKGNKLKII